MNITESQQGQVLVLEVDGRLDASTSGEFEKRLSGVLAGGTLQLVVGLKGLTYVSSAGLRAFLVTAKQIKAKGGKFALAEPSVQVKEILDLAGFSAILTVCDTQAQAIASCTAQ